MKKEKRKEKTVSLSSLREVKGLSQKELANELNVSVGLIGLYETGRRKPSFDRAMQIARYFDTPVERIKFDSRTCI